MLDLDRIQNLLSTVPEAQRDALLSAFTSGEASEKVRAVEDVLRALGQGWRDHIGQWIADLLSVESLVPEAYSNWRALVHECMAFVAAHISDARLAPKIVEQIELPPDTSPETRLGLVIAKTPGLQKLGQVLARTRRLSPSLRAELQKLENGIHDISAPEVREMVVNQLGSPRSSAYRVELQSELLSEASVSAILEFTWLNPATGKREAGVFKVMKPHVPKCYAEDLKLLKDLGGHLASKGGEYLFASREVVETLEEVRLLLVREVDFRREQATLAEVRRVYSRRGVRTPKVIPELCTDTITAMSVEHGVKVTEAAVRKPGIRRQIAAQIIGFLVGDPMFSNEEHALFHADPHAGNLLYDEKTRELIVLDWALTGRLTRDERRHVAKMMVAMTFRDREGVRSEIQALSRGAAGSVKSNLRIIDEAVDGFFDAMPLVCSPGAIDAMRLLDQIGVEGVRFPGSLVLIRKVLFTLDGVLNDITGGEVRMDTVMAAEVVGQFLRRPGMLPPPLGWRDYLEVQKSALRYVTGFWAWPSGVTPQPAVPRPEPQQAGAR